MRSQRQEELLLIEQKRQELEEERQQIAQIRYSIDQQRYDIEVRQNKLIELEPFVPLTRQLETMTSFAQPTVRFILFAFYFSKI